MEFIPYSRQHVTPEDLAVVQKVLSSDYLTQGDVVPSFERAFASRHAVTHGVAVANATAGLHVALLALGVGPGSTVWTSPLSFVASANCARFCGADVDFVDIDPVTRNLSVVGLKSKLAAADRAGKLPTVVIPVDFGGLPADLLDIRRFADQYGFRVLEDASHATGASYRDAPVGSQYVDAAVFSFHAVKIITTGEGGMVVTNDDDVARRLRALRSHGVTREPEQFLEPPAGAWSYEQQSLGFNYRMTEIQAALGMSQLGRLDQLRERRERLAARYDEMLAGLPLILPPRLADRESAWHLYPVELDGSRSAASRAAVFAYLRARNIGVNVHYIPIHTQPYYRDMGHAWGQHPMSERYYHRALSIPLFPTLTDAQQVRVVDALRAALEAAD